MNLAVTYLNIYFAFLLIKSMVLNRILVGKKQFYWTFNLEIVEGDHGKRFLLHSDPGWRHPAAHLSGGRWLQTAVWNIHFGSFASKTH